MISESAWLYGLFTVVALTLGKDGSPLAWAAVLALLTASYVFVRFLQLVIMPTFMARVLLMTAGVVAIYVTVASQAGSGTLGLDLTWLGRLVTGSHTGDFAFNVGMGSIFGAGLWWRGAGMASVDEPVEDLEQSFKIGLAAMAFAAIVDIARPGGIGIFPFMFLFFAAGLAGLSIGHLRPPSQRAVEEKAWFRAIAAVVSAVVVAGIVFTLIQKYVLSWLVGPISAVIAFLSKIVFFVVILPISYAVGYILQVLIAFINWLAGETLVEEEAAAEFSERALEREQLEAGEAPGYLTYIEWSILAVIVIVALIILAKAFRRRMVHLQEDDQGVRESVSEGADPASDLAHLLLNLLPDRFKYRRQRPSLRIPEGDADIADVFRIYFRLLVLAEDRGFPRPPEQTPTEYQGTLESIFPEDLVRWATAAFNTACYGHRAPPREQIDELRTSLEQLASEAG